MASRSSSSSKGKVTTGHPFFEIIEEVYRIFKYPKPANIEVCQKCCMDAEIEADFFNPPISDLPLEYVRDWYFAAYDPATGVAKATWGYLLPRILEIIASGEDVADVGFEVSLSRFDTGNPKNWSKEEWSVLDRYQRQLLQARIEDTTDFLDDVICMLRLAGWPLDDLITQVEAASSEKLALRLWNDWCSGRAPGRERIWVTAFWESPDNSNILAFYTSDGMYEKMASLVFNDDTAPELANKASAVASVMRP